MSRWRGSTWPLLGSDAVMQGIDASGSGNQALHYKSIREKCTLKQLKVSDCGLIDFNLTVQVDIAGAGWHG